MASRLLLRSQTRERHSSGIGDGEERSAHHRHQIKCLENEFGVPLFERSAGKMELTPEGRALLEKAIYSFRDGEGNEERDPGGAAGAKGEDPHGDHARHHPLLFAPFCSSNSERPILRWILALRGSLEMILERVESAEVDLGSPNLPEVPEPFLYHSLFQTALKLIAPRKNPFPLKGKLTLDQISKAPFIAFPRSSTLTPFVENRFLEENLNLDVVLVLNNYESVKKYVALGLGVSILDDYALTEEDRDSLDIFSFRSLLREKGLRTHHEKEKVPLPCGKSVYPVHQAWNPVQVEESPSIE